MKNAILEERNFVTPKEFCEILDGQISVSTVNALIKKGQIPSSRLGHKNLIPVWFAKQQINKGADVHGEDAPPARDGEL